MGPSPFKGQVEVGKRHKFEAYAPNYATAEQSLDVTKQEPLNIVLRLSESRSEGRVAIIARPAGAVIEIDQKLVGVDKWEGVLPSGGHNVTIKKDGYITYQQEIGVASDQVRTVETTLRQDVSRGAVIWAVGAALVVIGGSVTAFFVARSKDGEPVRGTVTNPDNGIMPTWLRR
ncbi:MAG: PEGA domain-containing protein [Myxococcales bacterium]|nr:PEGA domain-containing protein [Myxococcales bacterium]